MDRIRILALSGSLRTSSYNSAAIKALQVLAPEKVKITIGSIGELPLFNPDREDDDIPALAALINSLEQSDGLIIASPEYAHGISGPLKNALDWLVGGVAFPYTPIMLINTSPRACHAQDALKEVLSTMSGHIIGDSCLSIPLLGSQLDFEGIIENQEISDALTASLNVFCVAIESQERA